MSYTFLFANFGRSPLIEAVSASSAVLTIAPGDADLFPSPTGVERFSAVLHDGQQDPEIVLCSTNGGDGTFTVLRGQEGTVAKAWLAGTFLVLSVTAAALDSLR